MSLSIEIRRIKNIVVLDLAGRVSVLEPDLRRVAWELIEQGERQLLISLANVSYLDNSGLGQLCWIYTFLENRGGQMALLRPTPRIKRLLNVTKLDTVFRAFECESEAIAALTGFRSAVSA